jgi:hypothetical protein
MESLVIAITQQVASTVRGGSEFAFGTIADFDRIASALGIQRRIGSRHRCGGAA